MSLSIHVLAFASMPRGILALAIVGMAAGCSSFERDWTAAAEGRIEPATTNGLLAGRWKGDWLSDVNGHTGALRCLVRAADEPGVYEARFHATYAGWLTFESTVLLRAVPHGDGWTLEGSEDLGWLAGGVFRYRGLAHPESFYCRYRSGSDEGVFRMLRQTP